MIPKYLNFLSYHLINSCFRVIYSNDEKEDTIMKIIKKLEVLNVTDVKKQKVAAYAVNVNIKMYKSDKIKMYNYSKLT